MSTPETNPATQPTSQEAVADKTPQEGSKSEPTPEELVAIAEKRRRDTQAAYTKSQQALKAKEAELQKLREQLEKAVTVELPQDVKEELEELKYNDPEAWRNRMNNLEQEAKRKQQEELESLTGEARKAAEVQFELSRRQQVLEEFNASAKVPITDEIIANEVPPRITKKLDSEEISFEEFLSEVESYVTTGKTVPKEPTLGQPNLGEIGGGTTPSNTGAKADANISKAYANDIY